MAANVERRVHGSAPMGQVATCGPVESRGLTRRRPARQSKTAPVGAIIRAFGGTRAAGAGDRRWADDRRVRHLVVTDRATGGAREDARLVAVRRMELLFHWWGRLPTVK